MKPYNLILWIYIKFNMGSFILNMAMLILYTDSNTLPLGAK